MARCLGHHLQNHFCFLLCRRTVFRMKGRPPEKVSTRNQCSALRDTHGLGDLTQLCNTTKTVRVALKLLLSSWKPTLMSQEDSNSISCSVLHHQVPPGTIRETSAPKACCETSLWCFFVNTVPGDLTTATQEAGDEAQPLMELSSTPWAPLKSCLLFTEILTYVK